MRSLPASPEGSPRPRAEVRVRALAEGDSVADLTALLHRGYARLAAMGLNYTAVDQDDVVTRRRAERGTCLVAEIDGRIVGTLCVHGPDERSPHARYREPGIAVLEQFAVEPSLQGRGVGNALMDEAEARARAQGAREAIGDTAEPAKHLIDWYLRRGYRVVGTTQWSGKVYRSVVLSKPLAVGGAPTS